MVTLHQPSAATGIAGSSAPRTADLGTPVRPNPPGTFPYSYGPCSSGSDGDGRELGSPDSRSVDAGAAKPTRYVRACVPSIRTCLFLFAVTVSDTFLPV